MTLPSLSMRWNWEDKFEIIGFDACLMATVETGYVLKDYADFMLASQKWRWIQDGTIPIGLTN